MTNEDIKTALEDLLHAKMQELEKARFDLFDPNGRVMISRAVATSGIPSVAATQRYYQVRDKYSERFAQLVKSVKELEDVLGYED